MHGYHMHAWVPWVPWVPPFAITHCMGATLRINALLLACKQSSWGDNEA